MRLEAGLPHAFGSRLERKRVHMPIDPPAPPLHPPSHPIRVIERGIAARTLPSIPSPSLPYCLLGAGIVIGAIIIKLLGL